MIYRTNKFKNSQLPIMVNMTAILDNLYIIHGEAYVKQRLKNAQVLCQSDKGYTIHNDPSKTEITRHFHNWIIDYKEEFLDLCNIVVGPVELDQVG